MSPAEALRRAQLAVLRDPSRVKEWAAGRGPLPRPVAGGAAVPGARGTSPRVYAAFVVSGVAR